MPPTSSNGKICYIELPAIDVERSASSQVFVPFTPTKAPMRISHFRLAALVGAMLLAVACATAGSKRTDTAPCTLSAADSALADGAPLYPACAVDRKAERLPVAGRPDFRPASMGGMSCYSADIEIVVDSMGRGEGASARVLHTTDRTFADAVMAMVPTWRFIPAMRENRPVRQIFMTHEMVAFATVAVPVGSTPLPPRQRAPTC
jgi:hypothetical protein